MTCLAAVTPEALLGGQSGSPGPERVPVNAGRWDAKTNLAGPVRLPTMSSWETVDREGVRLACQDFGGEVNRSSSCMDWRVSRANGLGPRTG